MDKHFSGGVDLGEIQVHRAKLSAFNLGSIVFSIVGILYLFVITLNTFYNGLLVLLQIFQDTAISKIADI